MVQPDVFARYPDDAPLGHGLVRVDDEVVDDLADLPLVGFDVPEVVRNVQMAGGLKSAQGEPRIGLHQLGAVHRLHDRGASLGEGQELLGQVLGPERGGFDAVQVIVEPLAGGDHLSCQ